jgi:FKBP-type peptidyl-prolyl cis-trans isomerase
MSYGWRSPASTSFRKVCGSNALQACGPMTVPDAGATARPRSREMRCAETSPVAVSGKRATMQKTLLLLPLLTFMDCKSAPVSGPSKLETEEQKTLYALGQNVGRNLEVFSLSPAALEIVKEGLTDHILKREAKVSLETFGPKVQPLAQARRAKKAEEIKAQAKPFLLAAAREKGAQELPSGVVYIPIKEGTGEAPKATDQVKVQYRGTLTDGTVFDSTADRKQSAEFGLGSGIIPCWTEGLQKMKVGGRAKLACPPAMAYGDRGQPPKIPGGAVLSLEVELLEILPPLQHGAPIPSGGDPHAGLMMYGGIPGHGGVGDGGDMMPAAMPPPRSP